MKARYQIIRGKPDGSGKYYRWHLVDTTQPTPPNPESMTECGFKIIASAFGSSSICASPSLRKKQAMLNTADTLD